MDQMVQLTKQMVKGYVEKTGKKQAVKVEAEILDGDPVEEITKYAEKKNINLITLATHGRSGLKSWATGSVADKVAKIAKPPVWLIRAKGARPDIREKDVLDRALVPLDGSKESEAVIPYIEELAASLNAEVTLLQVLTPGYFANYSGGGGYQYIYFQENQIRLDEKFAGDYLDKIGTRLKRKGITVRSQVRLGNAAEEIIKLAADVQVDVVAMSTHGRSGIGRWILGSVADKILNEGGTPLLLVRPHK